MAASPVNPAEAAKVAMGAKLMDRILPGWHRYVNLSKLKMDDGSMCLLGQTFGVHAEQCIAREMYPEEWQAATDKAFGQARQYGVIETGFEHIGYNIAIGLTYTGGALPAVMRKAGVDMPAELVALKSVCSGHDTRCEWSAEIASRLAADGLAKEGSSDAQTEN